MISRPTIARISRENLKHNFKTLKGALTGGGDLMAVVKANAYGHGDIEVARTLEEAGATSFGVATLEEGVRLREGGVGGRIMIFGGIYPGQAPEVLARDLIPVVFDLKAAEELDKEAKRLGTKKKVHIKIDSGMGRIGLLGSEIEPFFERLGNFSHIEVEGLISHLAESEKEDKSFSRAQLDSFLNTVAIIRALGYNPPVLHIANSAALVELPASHLSLARSGLMLYGVYPNERFNTLLGVNPVMEFSTRIIAVKRVPAGFPVSYGRTWVSERDSTLATIAVGYADGLPWRHSGSGEALVRGKRVPIAGAVCMDMTVLDVTGAPEAAVGDEVILIGAQGKEEITALDLAKSVGTVPYEILCNIGERVPRVYV